MSENKSIVWVHYLRVIATFGVVLLHSAAPLLYKFNELPKGFWWYANAYDSLVRICVPLFFMISGFLLLGRQEPLPEFFRKRFNKIAVPLLAWSAIYVFWKAFVEHSDRISFYSLYSIALTPAYYHLWFLYAIIGVYLYVPIMRVLAAHSGRLLLRYYLLLWFVAVAIIPFGEKITKIGSRIDLLAISGYAGFFLLGHCLAKLEISKGKALVAGLAFLAAVALTATGTSYLTLRSNGELVDYLYGYLSPNVIVMSASFFVLARYVLGQSQVFLNPSALRLVESLSSASFGIYLVHAIFLSALNGGYFGFVLNGSAFHPALSIPATALIAFIFSYLTVMMIKRIPGLSRISP